ncbi:MAG: DUF2764 family protein [Candidatus Omnitrophota bacterium]
MDKYYYFVAQLPFLTFDEPSSIDQGQFLAEAKKWLSNKDFSILAQVSINDFYSKDQDPEVLKTYKDFELALREALASLRKLNTNQELKLSAGLSLNLAEGNPLEAEVKLLSLRWQFIENLESGHIFDLEALILYFLKLQILRRLFTFNKEAGTAVFDKLSEVLS